MSIITNFTRNAALSSGIIASTLFSAAAQTSQTGSEPANKPRNAKVELNEAHKRWLDYDGRYLLSEEERRAFKALTTNEERENFIEQVWRRRDPDPDTEENEFREEYYERIAYANEHFASGIPGWLTDRGRIYIKWGKPDSIESRPSGGSYDRPAYEGGGSTMTYPFEIWFYRHLDNVGDGIEIEFVDRAGTGEYKIARSPNEKDALATVPGFGRSTENSERSFQREQDSPFRRAEVLSNLERNAPVKFGDMINLISTDSGVVENNPLDVDLRVDYFRQSEDRVIAVFTVQAHNKDLSFKDEGGLETARINILGRITAVSGKRSGIFEDSVTANATTAELAELKNKKSIYQKAVALPPGIYKVGVAVRDVVTGNTGSRTTSFEVPRYDAKKLSTSSLILASKLRAANERETGSPFVIGNTKVIPNLSGSFKQGQEIGVYLQLYNAGVDQTTLRPDVDVEYVLTRAGKEVLRQKEDWSGLSDSGPRLTLARLLPTERMDLGDYEIRVVAKDRVGTQILENKSRFSIVR